MQSSQTLKKHFQIIEFKTWEVNNACLLIIHYLLLLMTVNDLVLPLIPFVIKILAAMKLYLIKSFNNLKTKLLINYNIIKLQ